MSEVVSSKQRTENGFAPIKKEFLDLNHKPRLVADYLPQKTVEELREVIDEQKSDEPAAKRAKLTGRNKKRPFDKRAKPSERLCPSIFGERVCTYGERCKFSHDITKFYNPQTDVGQGRCYVFETYGRCPFGITCVYAVQHTDESMKSVVKQELVDKYAGQTSVRNIISKDMQIRLRKREYDFSHSNQVLKKVDKEFKMSKGRMNQSDISASHSGAPDGVSNLVSKKTIDEAESVTPVVVSKEVTSCQNSGESESGVSSAISATIKCDAPESGDSAISLNNDKLGTTPSKIESESKSTSNVTKQDVELSVVSGASAVVEKSNDKSSIFCNSVGCVTDEGTIRLRANEKKQIDFRGKLYLAPLTTVGNLPFRRVCKRLGADITCGEMAMSCNLLQGQQSEWALIKRHESETLFGVQLCGSYADTMTRTVQAISENMQVDFIDINVGCPIDLVVQKGEGCALMGRTARFEQIVKCITSVTDLPLTVKMRTGLQEGRNIAHTLLPRLAELNVAMTTIHGRSREQRYTKLADWSYIKCCVEAAKPMPLFGNGDILSYMDYKRCLDSGVAGCMIARGALVKPWIFTEIKEQRDWDISAAERFEIIKEFTNYGLEHWGSDQQGVASVRRFLLEWLSFTHRYIPVGLLERVPQRINERPPYYFGRSDLETLLSSPNCADWIKISEMLLGPVPSDFAFLPKHRANAYQ